MQGSIHGSTSATTKEFLDQSRKDNKLIKKQTWIRVAEIKEKLLGFNHLVASLKSGIILLARFLDRGCR